MKQHSTLGNPMLGAFLKRSRKLKPKRLLIFDIDRVSYMNESIDLKRKNLEWQNAAK